MNSEEMVFQQYKLYTEIKEKFVDRSFMTNKFYLLLVLALVIVMFFTKNFTFCWGLSLTLIFSFTGMAVCVLWWINMDSYNFLIKVKFGSVIEEIEKQLPVKPYTMEFAAIKDYKKNKKMFVFSDMQKIFSIVSLLFFLVIFINALGPILSKSV